VTLRARWVTLRARWVTLRARWVTLRARWVTLRARWVMLRARWVTLSARWVDVQVLLTLQNAKFHRRATALRGLEPLHGLSQQRLQHICALLHERHFPHGAVLVEEGATSNAASCDWFLVSSGQLRITKKVPPSFTSTYSGRARDGADGVSRLSFKCEISP
jgi:hypothetical protein